MYEFIIIEQHNLRAKMPATQSFKLHTAWVFYENVTHSVYNVLLLFEVLYVPVVHKMGPHNGENQGGNLSFCSCMKIKRLKTHPEKFCKHIIFQCFDINLSVNHAERWKGPAKAI